MKVVQSWLSSTCKSKSSSGEATPSPEISATSEYSPNSSSPMSSSVDLRSDISLLTHPSVPSLQRNPSAAILLVEAPTLPAASLPPRRLPITCLAVHGHLLYSATADQIAVYDRRGDPVDSFSAGDGSSGSIKAVAFCGGKVFTAHQDRKIRVWKMTSSSKSEKKNCDRHRLVTALPTAGDRLRRFALPKNYVSVRRRVRRLWIEHADAVSGLAAGDGVVYSVSWDRSLKVWRSSDLRCIESVDRAHDDAVNAVAVSPGGTVYTGSADRRIRVWARGAGGKRHALVATLEKHRSAVNALALSGDGSVLFSGSCDRSVLVWEREDSASHMAVAGALRGHGGAVLSLFCVSDLLISGSADRTVRIWRRGVEGVFLCLAVLEGHARPVKSLVAVTEGGDDESNSNGVVTVFSGGLDGETKVWKVSVTRHCK